MTECTAGQTTMQDPRWLRPLHGLASEAKVGVGASTSFSHRRPAKRTDSFRSDAELNSMSLVFSADWVHVGAPIGEGGFSRVFEGLYTNPESGDQSLVAVKILKRSMLKRR